jgi:hypothetical protein
MTAVSDPRTQAFARITAGMCLIVANSSVAWSVTAANEYATARGVPLGNIVSLPLGTSRDWDPGSNAAIADFANTIRTNWLAKSARAVLIAPGCPARVRVRGVTTAGTLYNPDLTGLPAFGQLVMGSPSYASLLSGGSVIACREAGSSRWEWWVWSGSAATTYQAWANRLAWQLGLSDNRGLVDGNYELIGLLPNAASPPSFAAGSFPTTLASTYAGWSGSRVIPAGRIGWSAWRRPSSAFDETVDNWDGPLLSSLAANSLTAQPGPLLFSLFNGTGSMDRWAGLAKSCADWGYDTDYYYRQTSISSAVRALCPVAGVVWTKADFESGAIVGAPYYLFAGDSLNDDDPVRAEPFKSALAPLPGATVGEMGPSYGYEWGIRGLQTGAAAASMDITHRLSGDTLTAWATTWHLLRGMNGLEASLNRIGAAFPSGDPLHRPFHFDPAPSVPLFGGGDPTPPPFIPPYDNNPPTLQYNKRSDRFRDYRGKGRRW